MRRDCEAAGARAQGEATVTVASPTGTKCSGDFEWTAVVAVRGGAGTRTEVASRFVAKGDVGTAARSWAERVWQRMAGRACEKECVGAARGYRGAVRTTVTVAHRWRLAALW